MSNNTNPLLEQYFPKKSFKDLLSIGPDSAPESVREAIGCIEQMMREQARNITYTQMASELNTSTEYEAFKEIMNALVAYHKLHGQNTN